MIPGYQIGETLYESSRSLICRGWRHSDQVPVVLKQLKPNYPTAKALAQFELEYEIIHRLDLDGIIKVYSLESYHQTRVMVEEDFGAQSLDRYLVHHRLTLIEFLQLAIQITKILSELHQHHVLHKDVNPANILFNPATGQVKLIDFGIATVFPHDYPIVHLSEAIEGTPSYLSPEQTGRVKRVLDYRTDFYALGVTLYHLLCQRLPFESTDILELVHAHIAKIPVPPHILLESEINGLAHSESGSRFDWLQAPKPLLKLISEIVMKLMAKNAEDRYQSARGIQADLQTCLMQLQSGDTIVFPLGQQDVSARLQLPQTLYGRAQEIQMLLDLYDRLDKNPGQSEILLITGQAGIGKSALVQETYTPLVQRGYFVTGRASSLDRIPYSPFIQALRALMRLLLTESEDQLTAWREQLVAALGANGQVIAEVIPDINLIIGEQPAVPNLPLTESQNRFKFTFQQFIRAFTQSGHPLVIFLDDLQWIDQASLEFMQLLMFAPDQQSLLLVGAYRDREVDTQHPLAVTLNQLQSQGVIIHSIALEPLTCSEVNYLVADTLHCPLEDVKPLAELITEKTAGNPLFTTELLKFLHHEALITFDPQFRRWQWQLEHIQLTRLAETLVELVLVHLHRLPTPVQHLLQLAACMGQHFNSRVLAAVCAMPEGEVVRLLHTAVQADLIAPVGSDYRVVLAHHPIDTPIFYQFLHDRIHDTVYAPISETDRTQWHLEIGRILLQASATEQQIFEIVNHLNLGKDQITTQTERDQLAQLNLRAGNQAKSTVAYAAALHYLDIGKALLGESWQRTYELTLSLHSALAEAAYLNGDFPRMESLIEIVLHQARSVLDALAMYELRIQANIARDRFSDAIDTALHTLKILGVDIPRHPDASDILREFEKTKRILAPHSIADLVHLPQMTDVHKLAAMRIIASVCTPTYFAMPQLWQLMVLQKVQLSVHDGNAPGSAFGYSDYGLVLCIVGDIDTSDEFAQLAVALLSQREDAKAFVPRTLLLVNAYLKPWKEHLRTTLDPLYEAYQHGLAIGDLEYATFALAYRGYHAYFAGQELTQLEPDLLAASQAIRRFQEIPLQLHQLYRQVVLNLIGNAENPCLLIGESCDESTLLAHRTNSDLVLFHIHLNKLILCYLFGNYTQAVDHATQAEQYLSEQMTGMATTPVFQFYYALAQLAMLDSGTEPKALSKVDAILAQMQRWADHAPMNYLHKYYLIAAERCRVMGDRQAMDDYDRAITLAQEHGYLNEEALACERAAVFYLALAKPKIAQVYLQDAYDCYWKWGAIRKINDLETRYPQCRRSDLQSIPQFTTASTTSSTLNFATVMKAAQILNREVVLDQLLATLMQILMENAGAERGFLILEQAGQWVIEAGTSASRQWLQSMPITHAEAIEYLSTSIIYYVARTREPIVIANGAKDDRFLHDPYIVRHHPQSILCAPLMNQNKLIGIVYLENNLMTDAFTNSHLELVQLLSAQAVIAIDNARLYNELDNRVQQRTAELVQMNQQLEREIAERERSEQTLRLIIEGTAAVTRKDFFHSLVRSLAKALEVRCALITECDRDSPTRLRTIAYWYQDELGENFEYDVQDTPCEQVISSQGCCCYPKQLQSFFPQDNALMDMQAQSYAGIALLDSTGKLLGHLAILDDKPIENVPRNTAILEIFAARAAAEMERQQAEEVIHISQEKFAKAFRSSPSGIIITTMKEGRFIEANDSFLRMLGYSHQDLMGCRSLDLNLWMRAEDRVIIIQQLQVQGTVSNLEVELRHKSGNTVLGLVSAEMIDLEDAPCLLAVVTDITLQKQAAKALERLAEIGELASMIVHEIRNPLTTILMGLRAFKRLELSDRFQEYLSLALDEGDRLQRLLNQILLYAKPQTLNRVEVELNSLITETLTALQAAPVALSRSLQFATDFSSIRISADRDKLKQVLINLITNACEAVAEGEAVTVSLQSEINRIRIQVHNNGDPIPPEVLAKLTNPFFTTKPSGNGLGLAIVKRIVEAHCGEFSIESVANVGTTVTVKLPLQLT